MRLDVVRLDDGTEIERDVVRHPGAVAIVPILDDGRVVLLRQWRHPIAETLVELPAGTLEPGEDPLLCAKRELREETGYLATEWTSLGSFFTAPGFCDELMHLFKATGLEPGPTALEPGECLESFAVEPVELRRMIDEREIRDAKTLVGLLQTLPEPVR